MTPVQEQKRRKDFSKAGWVCHPMFKEQAISVYLDARKAAQVEIDSLLNQISDYVRRNEDDLKDRDQEIERLKETVNSCNERNRLLVEAGWKHILAKEQRDELIKELISTLHFMEMEDPDLFRRARKIVGE